jgi:deazaflavin-dependent oxidoreductase (nitroreductase family)
VNPYRAALRVVGRTRAFAWLAPRVVTRLDLKLRGRRRALSSLGTGLPLLYLTTTGRQTGEPRTVPLLHVRTSTGAVVVAASNWGRRRHPSWSRNLDANPRARLAVSGAERDVVARRATPAEYARHWPELVAVWPGYASYRARARRDIRMYVLEPADRD